MTEESKKLIVKARKLNEKWVREEKPSTLKMTYMDQKIPYLDTEIGKL
ncbi:MAG: hypothetical protein U9R43_19235 [Thermodesulfobacteriota bacterium]|nr:hypothetical protein [Thermodesulfobacteriota bacterium]